MPHVHAMKYLYCWPELNTYVIDCPLDQSDYSILYSCPSLTSLTIYADWHDITSQHIQLLHEEGIFSKLNKIVIWATTVGEGGQSSSLQFPLSFFYPCHSLQHFECTYFDIIIDIEEFIHNAGKYWKKLRILNIDCNDLLDSSLQYHSLINLRRLQSALSVPSTAIPCLNESCIYVDQTRE